MQHDNTQREKNGRKRLTVSGGYGRQRRSSGGSHGPRRRLDEVTEVSCSTPAVPWEGTRRRKLRLPTVHRDLVVNCGLLRSMRRGRTWLWLWGLGLPRRLQYGGCKGGGGWGAPTECAAGEEMEGGTGLGLVRKEEGNSKEMKVEI